MTTLYSIFFLIIIQVSFYVHFRNKALLGCISQLAFLPYVSIPFLINHNIDADLWDSDFIGFSFPVFLSLIFIGLHTVSLNRNNIRPPKIELICLMLFITFTITGSSNSYNPSWSYLQIAHSTPLLLIGLIIGSHKGINSRKSTQYFTFSLLGLAIINIMLILLAISLKKADSIFEARNAGSIYASTAFIASALLLLPFTIENWNTRSGKLSLLLTLTSTVLSLSRSILFIIFPLIAIIAKNKKKGKSKKAILGLAVSIYFLLFLPALFYEKWFSRLIDTPSALFIRWEEFSPYFEINSASLFQGVGWGMTSYYHVSGYTDLHNIVMTEVFESGYLAGASISLLLIFCSIKALSNSFKKNSSLYSSIFSIFYLSFLSLAITTGSVLSYRGPLSYCGVFIGVYVMILVGQVHREYCEKKRL